MRPRLIITGPTSALLHVAGRRIQFGAQHIPPGDIDTLVIGRISLEELAGLPAYLRRCNRLNKLETFTPSVKDLHAMLAADEVCCTFTNGSPIQVSLESWCDIKEVDPKVPLVNDTGVIVRILPSTWMRPDDSIAASIFIWDAEDEQTNKAALAVLEQNDEESAAWIDEENKKREKAAGKMHWKPVISHYMWAPLHAASPEGQHALFTQTRAPFDATAPQGRQHVKGTVFTDDNVGREYLL